jgi:DNA-binding transcriptional MocR family regulator
MTPPMPMPRFVRVVARAEKAYAERRAALVEALAGHGIAAAGDSGIGVWVPLADEAAAVRELLLQGWAVAPGERYRFDTEPGIRIATAALEPDEAVRLAEAIAALGDLPATPRSKPSYSTAKTIALSSAPSDVRRR